MVATDQFDFDPWVPDLARALQWRSLPSTEQRSLTKRLTELTTAHQTTIAFCPTHPQAIAQLVGRGIQLLSTAAEALQTHPQLATLFQPPLRSQTLVTAWRLWIPWSLHLAQSKTNQYGDRPLVQGLLGVQGTGKTTLGIVMGILLEALGRSLLNLSIDDFYLTYGDRQALRQQDPRLIWRGPPGTHDVPLALQTLDALLQNQDSVPIPRFDKSLHGGQGDRIDPELTGIVDIVWLEGWFVGCAPLDDQRFEEPLPSPLNSAGDRQFARDCNQRLQAYCPLWERLDQWAVLVPEDYHYSKQWRRQAERNRIANGGMGLTDAEVSDFVDYFWKALHPELFVMLWRNKDISERSQSKSVSLSPQCVVEIRRDRCLGAIQTIP
ncbi:MAG: glycerate kinase [Cyanobacteria bacterium P01_H01_bin.130]